MGGFSFTVFVIDIVEMKCLRSSGKRYPRGILACVWDHEPRERFAKKGFKVGAFLEPLVQTVWLLLAVS